MRKKNCAPPPVNTPTPWKENRATHYIEDANGDLVLNVMGAVAGDGDVIGKILRAVNAHEEDQEIIQCLLMAARRILASPELKKCPNGRWSTADADNYTRRIDLEAAIAKAERHHA